MEKVGNLKHRQQIHFQNISFFFIERTFQLRKIIFS